MIYLDNAATSGVKPKQVTDAVMAALKKLSANPGRSGHKLSLAASEMVYSCRSAVSDFFGASGAENVIFMPNCTTALNTVIKCYVPYGGHVIVSSLEHNSVMRPLETLRRRGLISYDVAEVIFDDEDAIVRSFENAVRPTTSLVVCTHASNVLGCVMPIKRIGMLCRSKKIPFVVDAAQTAGVFDINMQELGIDFLCVAPHKGLYAPMGTGILIATKPMKHTLIEGGTGSDSMLFYQQPDYPEGFESGTVNLPGIAGILAGISYVKQKGITNIYNHEMQLITSAYDSLSKIPNVMLYTSRPDNEKYAPVLSFNVRHQRSQTVAAYLDSKGIAVRAGLHCAPTAHKRIGTLENGTVRVSTAYFNTRYDIESLISAIGEIKNK